MHDWIIRLVEGGGYWGVLALMALENIFPPIPSELIMGVAGIAVAHGRMEPAPLMIAAGVGSTLGNLAWFVLGRATGYHHLKPFVDRWGRWLTLDWPEVEALARFFARHGQWVVFGVRFAPVMRTMISLPAGMAKMGWLRFTLFTLAGTSVWNAILLAAGYWLGRNFGAIDQVTGPFAIGVLVLVTAAYLWRLLRRRPATPPDT